MVEFQESLTIPRCDTKGEGVNIRDSGDKGGLDMGANRSGGLGMGVDVDGNAITMKETTEQPTREAQTCLTLVAHFMSCLSVCLS